MRFGGKCNVYFLKYKIFDKINRYYILLFLSCDNIVCYGDRNMPQIAQIFTDFHLRNQCNLRKNTSDNYT